MKPVMPRLTLVMLHIPLRDAMAESDTTLRVIPDRAAKILADRYKTGGINPLGIVAANGSLELEGIKGELITHYPNPETTESDRQQLDYLSWCVMETGERGPDPDWPRSPGEHSQ